MKKYSILGELLTDYRKLNNISQAELAAKLDVDIRSVIRWERNETLIKSEKEKDLVEQTFIPYQVIRNLNATVPIPVYYDFKIRKYSISEISIGMPDATVFKAHLDAVSPKVKYIRDNPEINISNIVQFHHYLYKTDKPVAENVILEASKLLPELNLILFDSTGFYAGHCVTFPLRHSAYEALKNRKLVEGELKATDLVNFSTEEVPVFYGYSVYADCNENIHYMMNPFFGFLKEHKNHIIAGLAVRPDGVKMFEDFGLKEVWTDEVNDQENGEEYIPTFLEGNLSEFKTQ